MKKKIGIALLAGGWSGEREVSLKSGQAVLHALDSEKYEVTTYDPRDDLTRMVINKDQIDLAFILLHGKFGEDGRIQGLLDILGVPYVGSGVLSSAMAMNKKITKEIFKGVDLRVAKDVVLLSGAAPQVDRLAEFLGLPVVIKPVSEGSSLGISLCPTIESISSALERAFQYDTEVMVEEYIKGREITCCVVGNRELRTFPIVEIIPKSAHDFFDYEAKYTPGASEEICPAAISNDLADKAGDCAKKAHRALQCRVWSRTDMIIQDNTLCVLETNTLPGMTENSLFPLAARAAGLTLSELLGQLISLSLESANSG